jgi:hypothetical protein
MARGGVTLALGASALLVGMLALMSGQAAAYNTTQNEQVLGQYLGALGSGNFQAAVQFLTPDVTFTWYGPTSLVPNAGQYYNRSGVLAFFQKVGTNFHAFVVDAASVSFPGATGPYVLVTFLESALNKATMKPYTLVLNTVFCTFTEASLIQRVRVSSHEGREKKERVRERVCVSASGM